MKKAGYSGIEEAIAFAEGLAIGCDYKAAYLILKKSTGQIYTQLFCEENEKPSVNNDDTLFLGQLHADTTYNDIMNMIKVAYAKELEDEKEIETYYRWLEEKRKENSK